MTPSIGASMINSGGVEGVSVTLLEGFMDGDYNLIVIIGRYSLRPLNETPNLDCLLT